MKLFVGFLAVVAVIAPAASISASTISSALEKASALRRTSPHSAAAALEAVIAGSRATDPALAPVWDALGDTYSFLHRPEEALEAHTAARVARADADDFATTMLSHAAVTTDLRMLHR